MKNLTRILLLFIAITIATPSYAQDRHLLLKGLAIGIIGTAGLAAALKNPPSPKKKKSEEN